LATAAVTIMSVAQRRSQSGLRRAVGYGRLEIARLIVLEAGGCRHAGRDNRRLDRGPRDRRDRVEQHWTPVMDTTLVLAAPFLGVAVGVLAGFYPAIRAARITPMAALRS
jgi:putative ABC transport system permease protein